MTKKNSVPAPHSTPMTIADAARIQSETAKANGGIVPKGSFAARAMRAAVKNAKP